MENNMNITTRLYLLLTILILTTGCASQAPSTDPRFDDLFAFDNNGSAIVRGRISGDWSCSTVNGKLRAVMNIDVPVLVDGIESSVELLFLLTFETELASDLTPYTTLRDYLDANPDSTTFDAFPLFQTVDVTFIKNGEEFEALAVRQAEDINSPIAEIDGMLSTNILSRGTLDGTVRSANWSDERVTWTLSLPVTVHGIQTSVLIPIESNNTTPVIANGNQTPMDVYHPGGHVQVEFKRSDNTLQALQFTELP
jgi:hypothetical protein